MSLFGVHRSTSFHPFHFTHRSPDQSFWGQKKSKSPTLSPDQTVQLRSKTQPQKYWFDLWKYIWFSPLWLCCTDQCTHLTTWYQNSARPWSSVRSHWHFDLHVNICRLRFFNRIFISLWFSLMDHVLWSDEPHGSNRNCERWGFRCFLLRCFWFVYNEAQISDVISLWFTDLKSEFSFEEPHI